MTSILSNLPESFVHLNQTLPDLVIDLRYATSDNITQRPLYASQNAYVHQVVAEALECVCGDLRKAGVRLKIWDAYRPLSVQQALWNQLPDPKFIADPRIGSFHNRGLAVDVTLTDLAGNNLIMPTPFDDFSPQAASDFPGLDEDIRQRREFLKSIMFQYEFQPLKSEWWHFMMTHIDAPLVDCPI